MKEMNIIEAVQWCGEDYNRRVKRVGGDDICRVNSCNGRFVLVNSCSAGEALIINTYNLESKWIPCEKWTIVNVFDAERALIDKKKVQMKHPTQGWVDVEIDLQGSTGWYHLPGVQWRIMK